MGPCDGVEPIWVAVGAPSLLGVDFVVRARLRLPFCRTEAGPQRGRDANGTADDDPGCLSGILGSRRVLIDRQAWWRWDWVVLLHVRFLLILLLAGKAVLRGER